MKDRIDLEAFYPHPPKRVWQALTDPAALSLWLMPADFKAQIGYRFRFQAGDGPTITGEVFDVEPGRRLAYTWEDEEGESPCVVRWTLRPKDGGTALRIEHEAMPAADSYVLIEASPNWRGLLLGALTTFLAAPVPIVYVEEEPEDESRPKRRAGFRQEEATCR